MPSKIALTAEPIVSHISVSAPVNISRTCLSDFTISTFLRRRLTHPIAQLSTQQPDLAIFLHSPEPHRSSPHHRRHILSRKS